MPASKSERLVNLTICLLVSSRYLSREQIRRTVEGYRGLGEAAFVRAFERDKDDLRAMGVPIETGSDDPFFEDEPGYRIRRSDFELPPVNFTSDELSVLGAAARVWHEASAAASTASALAKLRAAGLEPDADRLTALEPAVSAEGPAFDVLWSATRDRKVVEFQYRGGVTRHVEPWGMTWRSGHWYVVGRDRDKKEPRIFRVSRIVGVPRASSRPGAFEVPPDVRPAELARNLEPGEPDATAILAIRTGRAPLLRRQARPATPPPGATVPDGFDVVELGYHSALDMVGQVCAAAPDVLPLAPPELCDRVVAHLQGIVASHAGAGAGS